MVSVDEGLQWMKERIAPLGNHLDRYLLIARRSIDPLLARLEEEGLRHRVWLWDVAQDLPGEMDVVLRVGRNLEEKLAFLGTYQALQLVHLNLALLDTQALEISRSATPWPPMLTFLRNSADGFQRMISNYMSRVLGLLLPPERAPEFALLNVGSRWDRDDLDICIIDDGSERRQHLQRAVARLNTEMLRYVTRIDFHVAEEVGGNRFSASVHEYRLYLRRSPRDFVSASEMLNADIMLGSRPLFDLFKSTVKQLYLYRARSSNLYHEAYLRGSLGEIMILATRPVDETTLRPKEDAIRPIKGIMSVSRAVHNLEVPGQLRLLDALRRRDPERAAHFTQLEELLLFFETFRQLYHFHVEETEEIHLSQDIPLEARLRIAELMGYESAGTVDAWEGVVFRYHQKVRIARQLVLQFADHFKDHLRRISVFAPLLAESRDARSPQGMSLASMVSVGRHFRGVGFWDDLLDSVAERPEILRDLVTEVLALPERSRTKLVARLAAGVHRTTRCVMRLITRLYPFQRLEGMDTVIRNMVEGFLITLGAESDLAARLVHVFLFDSKLVCDFLGGLTEDEQLRVAEILRVVEEDEEPGSDRAYQVRRLCRLFYSHSRYFQAYFLRVVERHPYVVPLLTNSESLDGIVRGLGAWGPRRTSMEERRRALGDAFDIEVVQLGLRALTSPSTAEMRRAFSRFFKPYLASLFRVCRQEALERTEAFHMADADMGVFITGSTARGDAFAEDCDIFGLCAREEDIPFFSQVLSMMGQDLAKRGLMAHYVLSDALGDRVCIPATLADHLAAAREAAVVEASALLGAQLAVGGDRFRRTLQHELIEPHIYGRCAQYMEGMASQIEMIQQDLGEEFDLDMKEGPGGFRCQEMALLMLKAWGRLTESPGPLLAREMARRWPQIGEPLEALAEAMGFLRSLRDIYWITVSASNRIDPAYLHRPARFMGITGHQTAHRSKALLDRFHRERGRAGRACLEISRWVLKAAGV